MNTKDLLKRLPQNQSTRRPNSPGSGAGQYGSQNPYIMKLLKALKGNQPRQASGPVAPAVDPRPHLYDRNGEPGNYAQGHPTSVHFGEVPIDPRPYTYNSSGEPGNVPPVMPPSYQTPLPMEKTVNPKILKLLKKLRENQVAGYDPRPITPPAIKQEQFSGKDLVVNNPVDNTTAQPPYGWLDVEYYDTPN